MSELHSPDTAHFEIGRFSVSIWRRPTGGFTVQIFDQVPGAVCLEEHFATDEIGVAELVAKERTRELMRASRQGSRRRKPE